MVFSFFKKQSNKMPERPAARPRSPVEVAVANSTAAPAAADTGSPPSAETLPDLEFTLSDIGLPGVVSSDEPSSNHSEPAKSVQKPAPASVNFTIDDFDHDDFTESSVMGIDVDHDVDPLQACVEQVVVLYANSQDGAARSLLETFVRAYRGSEGKRFWLLLFDLLQQMGERAAFDKLCVEYAQACETSPPPWREESAGIKADPNALGPRKVFLQGVLTADGVLPVKELINLIDQGIPAVVDCGKLIGCDDVVAAMLADALSSARRQGLAVSLNGVDGVMGRLNDRLVAGEAVNESAWRLLLELLQRHGTQELFEERAVDYAVTFELSPPSWEPRQVAAGKPKDGKQRQGDDAHWLDGELKGCRFEDLIPVIEASERPVLDFSRVRRLDFISAGQLVNRLAPYKAAGREIVIRSPNHLVAELMAVVGLNKMARILVPKS